MLRLGFAALLLAGLALVTPAGAQNVTAANPDSVIQLLREEGLKAELNDDPEADPVVLSELDGTTFAVFFFDCTNHKRCNTIQFYVGFRHKGVTLEKINEWNARKRFGRAYLDDQDDPRMEMDLDLDAGGISAALFRENLDTWTSLVEQFREHIDF